MIVIENRNLCFWYGSLYDWDNYISELFCNNDNNPNLYFSYGSLYDWDNYISELFCKNDNNPTSCILMEIVCHYLEIISY